MTLAITAPEGDPVPRQLEQYMGEMEDVAQYCAIVSMDSRSISSAHANARCWVSSVIRISSSSLMAVMISAFFSAAAFPWKGPA